MSQNQLDTLITYNPWTVSELTPLEELYRLVQDVDFHHWPVINDERKLVGVLSDFEIIGQYWAAKSAEMLKESGAGTPNGSADAGRQARDIMVRDVTTVSINADPEDVLRLLLESPFQSLPVVDDGRLVAIVTDSDFLREYCYGGAESYSWSVQSHVITGVELIPPDMSLEDVRQTMESLDSSYLVVEQGGFPLGVVSQRRVRNALAQAGSVDPDLVCGVDSGPDVAPTLADLVSHSPTVRPGQRFGEAAQAMVDAGVNAVAVVNQANRLLGIVTEELILETMYGTHAHAG